MPEFRRISDPILDQNGNTIETNIRLHNASRIEIVGGDRGKQFRLKFATGDGLGWWVDRQAIDELITELLYIRREVVAYWGEDDEGMQPEPVEAPPF